MHGWLGVGAGEVVSLRWTYVTTVVWVGGWGYVCEGGGVVAGRWSCVVLGVRVQVWGWWC